MPFGRFIAGKELRAAAVYRLVFIKNFTFLSLLLFTSKFPHTFVNLRLYDGSGEAKLKGEMHIRVSWGLAIVWDRIISKLQNGLYLTCKHLRTISTNKNVELFSVDEFEYSLWLYKCRLTLTSKNDSS